MSDILSIELTPTKGTADLPADYRRPDGSERFARDFTPLREHFREHANVAPAYIVERGARVELVYETDGAADVGESTLAPIAQEGMAPVLAKCGPDRTQPLPEVGSDAWETLQEDGLHVLQGRDEPERISDAVLNKRGIQNLIDTLTERAFARDTDAARRKLPADHIEAADELTLLLAGVGEGQRNEAATRLAGRWISRGQSGAEVWQNLVNWNARNRPPLAEAELRSVFESVRECERRNHPERFLTEAADEQGVNLLKFRTTDMGNGELLTALTGETLRYDHKRDVWFVWRGDWWAEDTDGTVERLAKNSVRYRYKAATDIDDDDIRTAQIKHAIRSEHAARIRACIGLAQSEQPIADDGKHWDENPWLLGVANGVVDLRTGALRPGRRADRITLHTDVIFDPDATCPTWKRSLEEWCGGDADLAEYIRRAFGMSIAGDVSERVFFALYGPGSNGKSMMLRAMRHALGALAWNAGFDTFARGSSVSRGLEAMAGLPGKRLVTAVEANADAELDEARLKAIAGNDGVLTASHMYRDRFEFVPQATVWLAFNQRPTVRDTSNAFWQRCRLIPFEQEFLPAGKAGEGQKVRDEHLAEKLEADTPGILAWAVRACLDWQRDGLKTSAAVRAATTEYQTDSDTFGQFVNEWCTLDKNAQVKASVLYGYFKEWCERTIGLHGRDVPNRNTFGSWAGRRFTKRRTKHGNMYEGLTAGGVNL